MPVSNDIFDLVKGMNRKEKAYFRRYFYLHSAGKIGSILTLFEGLNNYCLSRDNYSEEEFKKLEGINKVKHFPVIKNNLYNLLLKSLNEYTEKTTNEYKVKTLIEQSDILFSRSLLKQSQRALKRAKHIAETNEMFFYIHTILTKERILARYLLGAGAYEQEINRISVETTGTLRS